MKEPVTPIEAPPTIEVVALKVAEELMAETFRRIADLEQRLQSVLLEADHAERVAGTGADAEPQLLEVAQGLLRQADAVRRAAVTTAAASPGAADGALVFHLPRVAESTEERDG